MLKLIPLKRAFILFLSFKLLSTLPAQTLGSELHYKHSYGFKIKRPEIDLYSDICIAKLNSELFFFPRRGISKMKSPCVNVLNINQGNITRRRLILPDSLISKVKYGNEEVESIVLSGNNLAMLLLREIHLFRLDSQDQKYLYVKTMALPGLGSELFIKDSILFVFGSYPSNANESDNNYVSFINLKDTTDKVYKYSLSDFNASAYKILRGTKYSFNEKNNIILFNPRNFNINSLQLKNDTFGRTNIETLKIGNSNTWSVNDSIYLRILAKYHRSPVSLFDELIATHIRTHSILLYQVWPIRNRSNLLVVGVPDSLKQTINEKYVILDSLNNLIKIIKKDSFPEDYIYTHSDYRPYANISYQYFDDKNAVFPRMTSMVNKNGIKQGDVYRKDAESEKMFWVFDIYTW